MYFHSQNLNEKRGRTGSKWRHGRCWFRIGGWELNLEWLFLKFDFSISIAKGSGRSLSGHFIVPGIAIYPAIRAPHRSWFSRLGPEDKRRFNLELHDWTIRFALWEREMEWRNADPWWVRGVHLNLVDFALGDPEYSTRVVEGPVPILVPMPEGNYRGTCSIEEATWKRPRWPAKRLLLADVKMQEPVPIPGKGENSWDCDDDAIHGSTFAATTIAEAIGKMVGGAMCTRERYASLDWRPKAA